MTYKIISPANLKGTIIELPSEGQHVTTTDNRFHFNRKYHVYQKGVIWCNEQHTKPFGIVPITKPTSKAQQLSFNLK